MTNDKTLHFLNDERNKKKRFISYWGKGEMAYTAIIQINRLKAQNRKELAKIMLKEWYL